MTPSADEHPVDVDIPWTSLYKYLGFMMRADLLDDHAYDTNASRRRPKRRQSDCFRTTAS